MKTILVLALFVAMLAMPMILADTGSVPNENSAGNPASIVGKEKGSEDGPGYSELGQAAADYVQENGGFRPEVGPGASYATPGHNKVP